MQAGHKRRQCVPVLVKVRPGLTPHVGCRAIVTGKVHEIEMTDVHGHLLLAS
jgi:transposase